jgi:hypothetical protein
MCGRPAVEVDANNATIDQITGIARITDLENPVARSVRRRSHVRLKDA